MKPETSDQIRAAPQRIWGFFGGFMHCQDCGTRLERNGVCSNCDEAAFITDWQGEFLENPSEEFQKEAADGYKRAEKRQDNE